MISRWPSQNSFGMWTVLYRTRSSKSQFGVSINVWRLAGNTLNITCNSLYCNHQVHRDVNTLYFIYTRIAFLQQLLDSLFDLTCFLSQMAEQQQSDLQQQQHNLLRDPLQLLQATERRIQRDMQITGELHRMIGVHSPVNDFISLMAGTLTVYHCPVRPTKVKR